MGRSESTSERRHNTYRVQSINRAIDILECFTYKNRELSLADISEKTGLDKSTVRRIVSNLEARDLLNLDSYTKSYTLGMRLFEWGGIVFSSFSLRKAAAHAMSHLEEKVGATTLLATKVEDQIIYVDKREGHGMIPLPSDIGLKRPLTFGHFGKIFLAYLDNMEVKRILKKYPLSQLTPYSITDENAFFLDLAKIRKLGYGVEEEEVVEGVMSVAAPIMDYSRKVIAAMCIALPASKKKEKTFIKSVVDMVVNACDEVSSNLGYLKI